MWPFKKKAETLDHPLCEEAAKRVWAEVTTRARRYMRPLHGKPFGAFGEEEFSRLYDGLAMMAIVEAHLEKRDKIKDFFEFRYLIKATAAILAIATDLGYGGKPKEEDNVD